MNIIIIGSGPAGINAASTIRKLDSAAHITLISEDSYPYYARPRLPEVISGKIQMEDAVIYQADWYQKNNIELLLNTTVTQLNLDAKTVITSDNVYPYDKLLLATGANPNKPPINGINHENIFTIRWAKDALAVKKAAENKQEIIAIGGGLLGLEVVSSLADGIRKIKVIEMFDHLLPRQLDKEQGARLQEKMAAKGFLFYLGEMSEKIETKDGKLLVTTQSGKNITGDIIVLSAGARANVALAQQAGLTVEKGIIVDQYLQTSHPDVYAAGDCVQFGESLFGFVKSALEHGQIAATNMLNPQTKEYSGTKIAVVLKVSGIDLSVL